jgi:hypothetical protein
LPALSFGASSFSALSFGTSGFGAALRTAPLGLLLLVGRPARPVRLTHPAILSELEIDAAPFAGRAVLLRPKNSN